jgi:hypothetical protein
MYTDLRRSREHLNCFFSSAPVITKPLCERIRRACKEVIMERAELHPPRSQLGNFMFFFLSVTHKLLFIVGLSYSQNHGSAMYLPIIFDRPTAHNWASNSQIISCSHYPSLLGSKCFQTECMSSGPLFVAIQVEYAVP